MNLAAAKLLAYGQTVYHITATNSDGTSQRFKVTGKVKTWKRDTSRIQVPVKRGLRECGYLTEHNIADFTIEPNH